MWWLHRKTTKSPQYGEVTALYPDMHGGGESFVSSPGTGSRNCVLRVAMSVAMQHCVTAVDCSCMLQLDSSLLNIRMPPPPSAVAILCPCKLLLQQLQPAAVRGLAASALVPSRTCIGHSLLLIEINIFVIDRNKNLCYW